MVWEAIQLSIALLLAMVRPEYLRTLILRVMSSCTYRNVRWYRSEPTPSCNGICCGD
jgi:hypothetical protein